jgi:multiple sugar transport system ATP-binding protein
MTGEGSRISGQTLLVEPTGAQTHVLFEFAGEQMTAVVDGDHPARHGTEFRATMAESQVYVFDAATGVAL